jgi:hypothetical protein
MQCDNLFILIILFMVLYTRFIYMNMRLKNIPHLCDLMHCARQVIFPTLPSEVRREHSGNFSLMFSNAVGNREWGKNDVYERV